MGGGGQFRVWAVLAALALGSAAVRAQTLPSLEDAAAQAQEGVATVRVLDEAWDPEAAEPGEKKSRVTVCTGVCVEKGFIVVPAFAGSDSVIRLTLPGGEQSTGQLRVIDEYSGLALVEADTKGLKPLKAAAATPRIGSWVLSAAAWGVERPIVSFGILSATDRGAGGLQLPPLLQADLRTTETSSGAALVNPAGELLGVVVLVNENKDGRGFSFAVPASHVQRLQRARVPGKPGERDTSVVVLKRRRPVAGMQLDTAESGVFISRVTPGGPAEKAGLKRGNIVVAIDGIKIRTVSQALVLVMQKQPGDVMTYDIQDGADVRRVELVLAGGVVLSTAPTQLLGDLIRPKIDIEGLGQGRSVVRSGAAGQVREVAAPGNLAGPGESAGGGDTQQRLQSPLEQIKLLQTALDRYQAFIAFQQQQLAEREQERRTTEARMKQLEEEVKALKSQMKVP